MSENNRRERSRTQQRNWEDTNQRNFEGSYEHNQDTPRITQSDPNQDYNTPQQYNQYQSEYPQNQNYSDWNTSNRGYHDQQRQSWPSRSYQQQQPHNTGSQNQGQYGPDDFNNPYWRENRQFGQQIGNQPYNNFRQQYSGQQFGGQPFSNYPGPQHSGNNSGRWNESNYRDSQSSNNYGRSGNFNSDANEQNRQGSVRVNEHGNLWSSGPHKGKGPKGYHRSDERIKEDISDRLMDDGLLDASNIEIEVSNNEVILSGNVDSRDAKRRAEELCESIAGVNNVENRLHISRDNNWSEKRDGASIGSEARRRSSLASSAS